MTSRGLLACSTLVVAGACLGPHGGIRPTSGFGKSCVPIRRGSPPACEARNELAVVRRATCSVLYRLPGTIEDPACARRFLVPVRTGVVPRWNAAATWEERKALLRALALVSRNQPLVEREALGLEALSLLALEVGLRHELARVALAPAEGTTRVRYFDPFARRDADPPPLP